MTHTSK